MCETGSFMLIFRPPAVKKNFLQVIWKSLFQTLCGLALRKAVDKYSALQLFSAAAILSDACLLWLWGDSAGFEHSQYPSEFSCPVESQSPELSTSIQFQEYDTGKTKHVPGHPFLLMVMLQIRFAIGKCNMENSFQEERLQCGSPLELIWRGFSP